jgi:hypothetical protein
MGAIGIAALIVFIAGAIVGIITLVIAGIRRAERDLTTRRYKPEFSADPDDLARARRLTGLYVRGRDAAGRRDEMFV